MRKINVAIVGVGSFAKALVEGVAFYTKKPNETIGLMHPTIGGYKVSDINFVAAFDVDRRKVGKPLHQALYADPNVTMKIAEPIKYKAIVHRGPTLDGVHDALRKNFIRESSEPISDMAKILREASVDIILNFVPSGGELATYAYAETALKANCSFINCIPTPLATVPLWQKRFKAKKRVLLGDDIKSQLGATMLNRILLMFLKLRGIRILKSEQINTGGNADHFNLIHRAKSKEKSKKFALTDFLAAADASPTVKFVYTGKSSGHKRVDIQIDGEMFGRVPISINSVIEDEISINGAGVVVDAIRMAKFLVDNNRHNEAWKVCPFLMKSPPVRMSDEEAFRAFEKISG